MSATPPAGPNGQRPTPPAGAPPLRRPRAAVNPLVPRKPVRRPQPSTSANTGSRPVSKPPPRPTQNKPGPPNFDALRSQNGGWSFPAPPAEDLEEYPLYLTKKSLKEGLRFHIMRFAPPGSRNTKLDRGIDPTNQDDFTRPVTLQRRDPRQPPPGREVKEEPLVEEEETVDTAEAERLAQIKEQREAQRAADNAQKAPVVKDANPKGKQQQKEQKKPSLQIHHGARTEEQKRQAEIRYEEALPWHLEDADGKNVWVGQYEAPLSDCKIALKIHKNGFRVIPLEKWYKFQSKRGAFQVMSIEDAEKAMNKKVTLGRWAIRDTQRQESERAMAESRAIVNGRVPVKQESGTFKQASRQEKMDHDDIDMSGDEFQDDDETAGYEPDRDEEIKQANTRIRRDQLNANLFGEADEVKVEKDEEDELKEELSRKLHGERVKKALKRRDKQFQYDSDSSNGRNPFASSEESDSDSDNEKDKDKDKEDPEKKAEKDKDGGNSTKGSNTPQKKTAEAGKKGKSLKRPGSPMVSDSSGTESTRKKKKTAHSRGNTPLPQRTKAGAGSTSDGEATAGEMSDGAGGKKMRYGLSTAGGKSSKGTPVGSRAGSPVPTQGATNKGSAAASRANSPGAPAQSSENLRPITAQEIISALPPPPEGISVGNFLKKFQDRVDKPGGMLRKDWLKLVKENAIFNNADKLLRRKV